MNTPRSVDTTPYHIWTDALHARALARVTSNEWNGGTYVRWAILSACVAFEVTASDMLGTGIGRRVPDEIKAALAARSLPNVDWGQGVWQRLAEVRQLRVDYVHRGIPQVRLFAPVAEADRAILVTREAIKALGTLIGAPASAWIDVDDDPNVARERPRGGFTATASATLIHDGAKEDDPDVVRVVYVYKGKESVSELLPPGSDPGPAMARLEEGIQVPITAIRAYRGTTLLDERALKMRGS